MIYREGSGGAKGLEEGVKGRLSLGGKKWGFTSLNDEVIWQAGDATDRVATDGGVAVGSHGQ